MQPQKKRDHYDKTPPIQKTKPGELIPITARQLESFMLEHNGRFNSRDYNKFERMELMESPIRDAIHELKPSLEKTLAQHFDMRLLGRGKRVFARLDAEDDNWYIHKLSLWAEPEDIIHYGNDPNKTLSQFVNR